MFWAGAERAEFVEHGMGTCEVAAEQGGAVPGGSSGPVLGQFFLPGFNKCMEDTPTIYNFKKNMYRFKEP